MSHGEGNTVLPTPKAFLSSLLPCLVQPWPNNLPSWWFTAAPFVFWLVQPLQGCQGSSTLLSYSARSFPAYDKLASSPSWHLSAMQLGELRLGTAASPQQDSGKWAGEGEPGKKPSANKHRAAEIMDNCLALAKTRHSSGLRMVWDQKESLLHQPGF